MQNEQLEQARLDTSRPSNSTLTSTNLPRRAISPLIGMALSASQPDWLKASGGRSLPVSKRRFGSFVVQKCQTIFSSFLSRVFASQSSHTCEAMLLKEGKIPFTPASRPKFRHRPGVPRGGGGHH